MTREPGPGWGLYRMVVYAARFIMFHCDRGSLYKSHTPGVLLTSFISCLRSAGRVRGRGTELRSPAKGKNPHRDLAPC